MPGSGNGGKSVHAVVRAEQLPLNHSGDPLVFQHLKMAARVLRSCVPARCNAESLDGGPASQSKHSLQGGIRTIRNHQTRLWDGSHEMMKLSFNRCKIGEDVCMIELKIIQHKRTWPVVDELGPLVEKRGVVLVGFDDEVFR